MAHLPQAMQLKGWTAQCLSVGFGLVHQLKDVAERNKLVA